MLTIPRRTPGLIERFKTHVKHDAETGCFIWTASVDGRGYGKFYIGGISYVAHRVAYTWQHDTIPDGLVLDHLCRIHRCVNPRHLEPVTTRENLARGTTHMAKTHCKWGHPLSGDNVRVLPDRRVCKTCERQRMQEWKARQQGA